MSLQTLLSRPRRRPQTNRNGHGTEHRTTQRSLLDTLRGRRARPSDPLQHSYSAVKKNLPTPAYGSVWLACSEDGDPNHLSPLVRHALGVADAVIHDPGIPARVLDLVRPPRYREAATPRRALQRAIKLAEDGWRVVWFVGRPVVESAIETAATFSERGIPLHVALSADEASGVKLAPMLVSGTLVIEWAAADQSAALLASPVALASAANPRLAPISFSMSGLAG